MNPQFPGTTGDFLRSIRPIHNGDDLRIWRAELGYSQNQMARHLFTTDRTYRSWEARKQAFPKKRQKSFLLARAVTVCLPDLIEGVKNEQTA
jgi:DNA-binding transcriptional regulator YiaG